jgi:lauroyl-KDO2-lipid IV(A) myristoyltransferase
MSTVRDPVFDDSFKSAYLHPKHWLTWLSLGLLAVLAWLPARPRDAFARLFAPLVIRFSKRQCNVARTNFSLCFPELDEAGRESLLKSSIEIGLQTFLAFAEATFLPKSRFLRRFTLQGWEHVEAAVATGKPVIFMIPHSWAIDLAGLYMTAIGMPMCTMMKSARNPVYDWFINRQRACFGGKVYERSVGIKPAIKAMREGLHFFYLPDQDHGAEASLFVPLFGQMKATLPALPKLAKLADALVVPMFSAYDPQTCQYQLIYRPALAPYPGLDLLADTRKMNEEIEILLNPRREQYMWFLKYFRSRPAGDTTQIYAR